VNTQGKAAWRDGYRGVFVRTRDVGEAYSTLLSKTDVSKPRSDTLALL
jgi:hypothetical protein